MFFEIFTITSILSTFNAYYIKNDITCVSNKVIPHPTDCGKFIKCGYTDKTNIVLNCTYPTLFNRRILDCDRPQNVFCQTYNFVPRDENLIETVPKNEPEKVYCPPGCLFPHPTDCNRFIQCGKTLQENKEFRCPTSMLYNHLITGCDLAQNVICITYNYIFISDDQIENQNQIIIEQNQKPVSNASNNDIKNESELMSSTGIMTTKQTTKSEKITTEEITMEPETTEILTTGDATDNIPTTEPLTTMESKLENSSTAFLTTEEITMEPETTEILTTGDATDNILTTEPLTTMESILENSSTAFLTTEEITMEPETTEILTTEPLTTMESILETQTSEPPTPIMLSVGNLTFELLTPVENQTEENFDFNVDLNETQAFFSENIKNFNVSQIETIDRFNNTIEVNYIITNESDTNLLISEIPSPQNDFTESIVKNYFFNYLGKIRKFFVY